MNFPLILNLLVFLALLFGLSLTRHTAWNTSRLRISGKFMKAPRGRLVPVLDVTIANRKS